MHTNNDGVQKKNIKDILDTLLQTESKIVDLQQFSSNDFSLLNQKFIAYHKHTSELTGIVFNFTKLLWDDEEGAETCLKSYLGQIIKTGKVSKITIESLTSLIEHFSGLTSSLHHIHIPLNNFKQNLYTLKLLSANLKIDKTLSSNKTLYKRIDDLILILDYICLYCPKIDTYLQNYQLEIEKVYNELSSYLNNVFLPYNLAVKEITEIAERFSDSLDDISNSYDTMVDNIKSNSQNVETIITQLQYQDIIRQRIEHIQQTHSELINNIRNIEVNDKHPVLAKNFTDQIKDIVGLQAAHLLHINKEFQSAIETISDTIQNYSNNVCRFIETTDKIIESFNDKDSTFSRVFEKYNTRIGNLPDINTGGSKSAAQIADIDNSFNQLTDFFNEIKQLSEKLNKINTSLKKVNKQSTIAKIEGLLNENLKHAEKINRQFERINMQGSQTSVLNNEFIKNKDSLYFQLQFINNNQISAFLKKLNNEIISIKNNLSVNLNEQNELGVALQQMQYYIYFEKNIQSIVNLLENANMLFENIVDENGDIKKNIEHIKKRYTTTSEHEIHDIFSKDNGSNLDELIASFEQKSVNDNDDNIEFF